jgi:hypothetical protein
VDNGSGEPDDGAMNVLGGRSVVRTPTAGLTAICLGFLMITLDATNRQRGLGADRRGPRPIGVDGAVDRQRVHPGLRRAAALGGRAG